MEFGAFIPIANDGWFMSGTSPKYMPTFELTSEICAGLVVDLALPTGALQLNCKQPYFTLTVTGA
jgi:hypothetical protein